MKPATAALKLDVYLPATPPEFHTGEVSREQLEQMVLHGRGQGLHHVHVAPPAVRPQLDLQAVVAEPRGPRRRQLDAEDVAHLPRERRMRGA